MHRNDYVSRTVSDRPAFSLLKRSRGPPLWGSSQPIIQTSNNKSLFKL
jgi:hypothetical protein